MSDVGGYSKRVHSTGRWGKRAALKHERFARVYYSSYDRHCQEFVFPLTT